MPSSTPSVQVPPKSWRFDEALRCAYTVVANAVDMYSLGAYENIGTALGLKQEPLVAQLDGKVCIVTGANSVIGQATSEALARMGAHVILACRSKERGEAAAQSISKALAAGRQVNRRVPPPSSASSSSRPSSSAPAAMSTAAGPARVEVMELDLASLDSVRAFVKAFNAKQLPLHLLVCNAGVMAPLQRLPTVDGNEMQFQVNFLSHWLLANGLLAEQRRRRKGSPSTATASSPAVSPQAPFQLQQNGTRVVFLSSCTHIMGKVVWHDMQAERSYSPFASYGFTKMAAIMTAAELQRRLDRNPGYGLDSAVSVHPGVVDSPISDGFFTSQGSAWCGSIMSSRPAQSAYAAILKVGVHPILRSAAAAAQTVLYAALAPARAVGGRYVVPQRSVAQPDEFARDEGRAQLLWELASTLTGTKIDPSLA